MQNRIEDIVANPRNYFTRAFEVVDSSEFTVKEKRRILESWALDARQLAESSAENMTGGEESDLRDVSKALLQLKDAEEHSPPVVRNGAFRAPVSRVSFRNPASPGATATLGGAVGAGAGICLVAVAGGPLMVTILQTTLVGAIVGGFSSVFLRSATR